MASARICDVDGTVEDMRIKPPNVEDVSIRFAAEEYEGVLCSSCKATKSLSEIIAAFKGKPGGTADGASQLAYLVRG